MRSHQFRLLLLLYSPPVLLWQTLKIPYLLIYNSRVSQRAQRRPRIKNLCSMDATSLLQRELILSGVEGSKSAVLGYEKWISPRSFYLVVWTYPSELLFCFWFFCGVFFDKNKYRFSPCFKDNVLTYSGVGRKAKDLSLL